MSVYESVLGDNAQKSWDFHLNFFEPIMENVFIFDILTKIHFIDALNKLSQNSASESLSILKNYVFQNCKSNEEKAAYYFFVSIANEFLGYKDECIKSLLESSKYEPNFYLVYLKLAKFAHADAVWDFAEENYIKAINCLNDRFFPIENYNKIFSSVYSNLASCLTMMHRYTEALEMFEFSEKMWEDLPERNCAKAILFAAMEQTVNMKECLDLLEKKCPKKLYESTKKQINAIINRVHPHFFKVEYDKKKIVEFWQWFCENEENLRKAYSYDSSIVQRYKLEIEAKLKDIFTFVEHNLEVAITFSEKFVLVFVDFYSMGLHYGYDEVIDYCSAEIKEVWDFAITR